MISASQSFPYPRQIAPLCVFEMDGISLLALQMMNYSYITFETTYTRDSGEGGSGVVSTPHNRNTAIAEYIIIIVPTNAHKALHMLSDKKLMLL